MRLLAFFTIVFLGLTACQAPNQADVQEVGQTPKAYLLPFAPASARVENRDSPSEEELNTPTRVVMLGTGTPIPDAYRAGPSIAVIHKGEAYIFDAGSGAVQRATEARYKYDIPSLYPTQIKAVFITHMHSDHTLDYVELSQTMWWRRRAGLLAFGPKGLKEMTKAMTAMMAPDTRTRRSGTQPLPNPEGNRVQVTEIEPGIVFEQDGMIVEAFNVPHGDIDPAFGYKIVTPDLSIVISGDTAKSKIIQDKAAGVDLLFHEVISDAGLARSTEFWQNYHKASHTTSSDIGKLAAIAKPKKVVLYHGLFYGASVEGIVDEVKAYYDGEVVFADDLDMFE